MAQVSRPYQIALAVLALFAAVWFIALHRPGSGSSSGTSGSSVAPAAATPAPATAAGTAKASTPAAKASAPAAAAAHASANGAGSPGASTPVYHGAAPGVEGLTRAIDRAHGAVATSEQNAAQLQQRSAQASEATPNSAASSSSAVAPAGSAATSSAQTGSAGAAATTPAHQVAKSLPSHVSATAVSNAQAVVLQSELKHGQTVLLLFWNPQSTDDASVRKEAKAVAARSKGKVVLHVALPAQVGQYGSVTRGVQVYQTPTLLLIDKKGLAVTMTGLMDQYAIEQGILEAKHGSAGA